MMGFVKYVRGVMRVSPHEISPSRPTTPPPVVVIYILLASACGGPVTHDRSGDLCFEPIFTTRKIPSCLLYVLSVYRGVAWGVLGFPESLRRASSWLVYHSMRGAKLALFFFLDSEPCGRFLSASCHWVRKNVRDSNRASFVGSKNSGCYDQNWLYPAFFLFFFS